MRVLPYGPRALLVELDSTDAALALYAAARSARVPADEVVPAARTVLFDGVRDLAGLTELLGRLDPAAGPGPARRAPVVEVPTVYDGADLDEVARQWGMDAAAVVALHASTEFTVAFCGFSPGFAYCTGLPAGREIARRPSPRSRVPAGSVALAGRFTAVYPSASPGGWQLVGRTDLAMWDPESDPPARLAPGTRVRFRPVTP